MTVHPSTLDPAASRLRRTVPANQRDRSDPVQIGDAARLWAETRLGSVVKQARIGMLPDEPIVLEIPAGVLDSSGSTEAGRFSRPQADMVRVGIAAYSPIFATWLIYDPSTLGMVIREPDPESAIAVDVVTRLEGHPAVASEADSEAHRAETATPEDSVVTIPTNPTLPTNGKFYTPWQADVLTRIASRWIPIGERIQLSDAVRFTPTGVQVDLSLLHRIPQDA